LLIESYVRVREPNNSLLQFLNNTVNGFCCDLFIDTLVRIQTIVAAELQLAEGPVEAE